MRRFTTSALLAARYQPNPETQTLASLLRETAKNSSVVVQAPKGPVILPPRTGPYAGRSVAVTNQQPLSSAIRHVNMLNNTNKVKVTKRLQQSAERPGKARLRIAIERKRREFHQGVRKLFALVNEARRKGY